MLVLEEGDGIGRVRRRRRWMEKKPRVYFEITVMMIDIRLYF